MFTGKRLLTDFLGYEVLERIRDGLYFAARHSRLGGLLPRSTPYGAAILVYHSVGGTGVFHDNALETGAFRRHLEFLTATRNVVPLQCIVDALLSSRYLPEDWVALTFDDGYRDFVDTVVPLLESYNVPATLFVPSCVLSGMLLFPDRLTRLIAAMPRRRLDLQLDGNRLRLSLTTSKHRREAALRIALAVRTWAPQRREEWLDEFGKLCQISTALYPSPYVSERDLAMLSKNDLVEIGSHSVSHPNLAALSQQEALVEVGTSRDHLGQACGREVTSFAYPFGKAWSFDETTKDCLRRAGYRCGLSTQFGFVHAGTDPYAIPRIGVRASMARLELQLRGARL